MLLQEETLTRLTLFILDSSISHKLFSQENEISQVNTSPGDPHTFMSSGEDGTIRLFDVRSKTKCLCDGCKEVGEVMGTFEHNHHHNST